MIHLDTNYLIGLAAAGSAEAQLVGRVVADLCRAREKWSLSRSAVRTIAIEICAVFTEALDTEGLLDQRPDSGFVAQVHGE
jgi:acyl carrier protein phosphodiesterase